jgi:hypothetical protein
MGFADRSDPLFGGTGQLSDGDVGDAGAFRSLEQVDCRFGKGFDSDSSIRCCALPAADCFQLLFKRRLFDEQRQEPAVETGDA